LRRYSKALSKDVELSTRVAQEEVTRRSNPKVRRCRFKPVETRVEA
jgi:hypothetical protein